MNGKTEPEFITRERFVAATGVEPEHDDLERCNCPKAGEIAHSLCGWDNAREMPNFIPPPPPSFTPEDMRHNLQVIKKLLENPNPVAE